MVVLLTGGTKLIDIIGICITLPAFITIFVLSLLIASGCGDNYTVQPDASPDAHIASFGEGCQSDSLCETGQCEQTYREYELPNGMCTNDCVWGSGCNEGYCVFYSEDGGYCFPSCEQGDDPCRNGWECYFVVGVRLCAPEGW